MDAVLLIVVGASLAHLSAVATEWRRRRLDRAHHRGERLRTFRVERLLALQAALFALEEAARHARAGTGDEAERVAAAAAQVRRTLVLVDDPALRQAALALLGASPAVPEGAIDAANAAIGERVRALAAG